MMKDKEPFDLGGASSKSLINWIFWWETGLATFSIVGAYYVVPNTLKPLFDGKGWVQAVCGRGNALDDPISGYWTCLFCVSLLCLLSSGPACHLRARVSVGIMILIKMHAGFV